jgi:hypothetical protein
MCSCVIIILHIYRKKFSTDRAEFCSEVVETFCQDLANTSEDINNSILYELEGNTAELLKATFAYCSAF